MLPLFIVPIRVDVKGKANLKIIVKSIATWHPIAAIANNLAVAA